MSVIPLGVTRAGAGVGGRGIAGEIWFFVKRRASKAPRANGIIPEE